MSAIACKARAVMMLGTASHVGKSTIVAALCRIFANMGIDVAPFKAQNMSLNSAATVDGREIGRAQALQAEAARRPPIVEMNPILIKPSGDTRSQIVVDGTIWGDTDAWDYHRRKTDELFPRVLAAYERLAASCGLVVLEGAGSPAEINLKDRDIVNLRMAAAVDAPCVLIADIDRGGVFASLLGTLALLDQDERARIRGFIVNKFRGDLSLLAPGIALLEQRLGIPCLGIVPWLDDLALDEEDSYGVIRSRGPWDSERGPTRALRVAIIELPLLANATDFAALEAEPDVALRWINTPEALHDADVVIVPGSKQTLSDLRWMCERRLDRAIATHAEGKPTIGICGGLQMLGSRIADPHGVEGGGASDGIGVLPLSTSLTKVKTTTAVRGVLAQSRLFGCDLRSVAFSGYEIHVGESSLQSKRPFAYLTRAAGTTLEDGAVSGDGNAIGTYVHGLFDDDDFRRAFIDALRDASGLTPASKPNPYSTLRDARLERLADHVRSALDVDAILRLAGCDVSRSA